MNDVKESVLNVFLLGVLAISVAAWLTHIIYCIAAEKFLLLIAGALVAPVGIIHGVGIWFGAW